MGETVAVNNPRYLKSLCRAYEDQINSALRQEIYMRKVIGPDVSVFQDDPNTPQTVNFTVMKQVSDFVIVRAGQNLWPDSKFAGHWRRARTSGLPRGSYWLYDSRADPK